jgi:N-acetyl-anhydromuramyl-L-alanine amidase AmpD
MALALKPLKQVDLLVVHCSATKPTQDIGAKEIDAWHRKAGWLMIGYHFVIRRDGTVEEGRPADRVGSHVRGHNSNSIGICMVGGVDDKMRPADNFTPEQKLALLVLLRRLREENPEARICGHRELSPDTNNDGRVTPEEWLKACPSFDVGAWWAANHS